MSTGEAIIAEEPRITIYSLAKRMKQLDISKEQRREYIKYVNSCLGRFWGLPSTLFYELESFAKKGIKGDEAVKSINRTLTPQMSEGIFNSMASPYL